MGGILIDLDGVIYEGDNAVSGAAETVALLQKHRVPHLFLTNTTSKPLSAIRQKLQDCGIQTTTHQILTPVVAARHWINANHLAPAAMFVPDKTLGDFGDIEQLPEGLETGAGCIVLGDLGEQWDFARLNTAFRLLISEREPPSQLIALGMTRYWRAKDGLRLDVAPFVKALEHASGAKAVVLGKPSADFFQQAANILETPLGELAMIGDDITGDVGGAQRSGLRGLLVRTGKYRPSDLQGPIVPDAVLDSIVDLPRWINQNNWGEVPLPEAMQTSDRYAFDY